MKVENKVMPNEKQMEEFLEEGHDEPIFMVNLLKFKERQNIPINEKLILLAEGLCNLWQRSGRTS